MTRQVFFGSFKLFTRRQAHLLLRLLAYAAEVSAGRAASNNVCDWLEIAGAAEWAVVIGRARWRRRLIPVSCFDNSGAVKICLMLRPYVVWNECDVTENVKSNWCHRFGFYTLWTAKQTRSRPGCFSGKIFIVLNRIYNIQTFTIFFFVQSLCASPLEQEWTVRRQVYMNPTCIYGYIRHLSMV